MLCGAQVFVAEASIRINVEAGGAVGQAVHANLVDIEEAYSVWPLSRVRLK